MNRPMKYMPVTGRDEPFRLIYHQYFPCAYGLETSRTQDKGRKGLHMRDVDGGFAEIENDLLFEMTESLRFFYGIRDFLHPTSRRLSQTRNP